MAKVSSVLSITRSMIFAISISFFVILLGLLLVARGTRAARGRNRLRRLYARQGLEAQVTHPEMHRRTADETAPAAAPVDDRQMTLFADLHHALTQVPVVPPTRPAHPLRRRSDRIAPGERLDWQYFNKDAGDLGYPEAPERRRPSPVAGRRESRPERRA